MTIWASGFDVHEVPGTRTETWEHDLRTSLPTSYTARVELIAPAPFTPEMHIAISRTQYPYAPNDLPWVRATRVVLSRLEEAQTFDTQGGTFNYDWCKLSVDYAWDRGRFADVEFSQNISPTNDSKAILPAGLYWTTTPPLMLRTEEAPTFQNFGATLRRHITNAVAGPPAWYFTLHGSINSDAYLDPVTGHVFPPYTLCYEAGEAQMVTKPNGVALPTWQWGYNLHFKRQGWNRFYLSRFNQWLEIIDRWGNPVSIYDYAPFSNYF